MRAPDSSFDSRPLKLAISTCPNDTFAFHAILNQKIDLQGLEFEIELLDIQQLNDGLLDQRFDVAKASFHAALRFADQTMVLPSGSALGFGVGPLLLASKQNTNPNGESGETTLTLCPGELTTATMLFKLFYSEGLASSATRIDHCVFSDIMPSLQSQSANFGVCIHEGRFTWQEEGLFLVEDLGTRWEQETDSPLPLGGIVVRRGLPNETVATIQNVIQSSIKYGLANRAETIPTMRKHAQEFSDDVLMSHVDLYVNQWTVELGSVGENALRVLAEKAKENSLVAADSKPLEVWRLQ